MLEVGKVRVKLLFAQNNLDELLRGAKTEMLDKASSLLESEVAGTDAYTVAENIWSENLGPEPHLVRESITRRTIANGSPNYGHWLVCFHIPFEGEAWRFYAQPSEHPTIRPKAIVNETDEELEIYFETDGDDIDARLEEEIGRIERCLANGRKQIAQERSYTMDMLAKAVRRREHFWRSMRAQEQSSAYPLHERSETPSAFKPVSLKAKIASEPPRIASPLELEPVLHEAQYQDVLGLIAQMGRVVELAPRAFESMEEEHLRFVLLVPLNMRFEGEARAEAFSHKGKTDIHIQHRGASIFVAECKIWRGQKEYAEAIDQLLRYTTLRDTKTALILFNRHGEFTDRFSAIRKATETHPNHVRLEREEGTTLRYTMRAANDTQKTFTMTVVVFDVPSAAA